MLLSVSSFKVKFLIDQACFFVQLVFKQINQLLALQFFAHEKLFQVFYELFIGRRTLIFIILSPH